MGSFFSRCDDACDEDTFVKQLTLCVDRNQWALEIHEDKHRQLWIARRHVQEGAIVARRKCVVLNFSDKKEAWIGYGPVHDMMVLKLRETNGDAFVVEVSSSNRTWLHPKRSLGPGDDYASHQDLRQLASIVFWPAKAKES